jgi:DNA-binding FadR family transcriptional regulator
VGVAGLAAERRTRTDLSELKRTLDRMRRCSDRDDVDGFTEADLEFHGSILAAAGNTFLTALFEPLVDLLFEVRRASSGARPGRATTIAAHSRILDALRAGSPEGAREAMGVHMHETAERIDEVIRQDDMRLSLPRPDRTPS